MSPLLLLACAQTPPGPPPFDCSRDDVASRIRAQATRGADSVGVEIGTSGDRSLRVDGSLVITGADVRDVVWLERTVYLRFESPPPAFVVSGGLVCPQGAAAWRVEVHADTEEPVVVTSVVPVAS